MSLKKIAPPRGPLTTCQQVSDCTDDPRYDATAFALTGTVASVTHSKHPHFTITDFSGFSRIIMAANAATSGSGITVGDIVTVRSIPSGAQLDCHRATKRACPR